MNQASQSIRVGLFFLLGICLCWIVYETLSESSIGDSGGYRLRATFENLQQLKPSDEVRLAGVRIGNVVETELDGVLAVAVLSINPNVKIPADSEATIVTAGLLGANYVAIVPGESATYLAGGDDITTFKTPGFNDVVADVGKLGNRLDEIAVEVKDALGGLKGLTGGGEGGDLFSNLNEIVTENRERINNTLANFDKISSDIANGKGTVGKLISDDSAYDKLLATADDISAAAESVSSLTGDAKSIVADVKAGKGAIGAMLYDETTAQNLKNAIANVESFTAKLDNDENTLGRILQDDQLFVQAQDTLSRVNGAVGRLDDSGPITAVGILASALF